MRGSAIHVHLDTATLAFIGLKSYNGAPRSTKMGNIASPSRYDAGACHTLEPENTRPPAILALCRQCSDIAVV